MRKITLYLAGRDANLYHHYREQYAGASENYKWISYVPAVLLIPRGSGSSTGKPCPRAGVLVAPFLAAQYGTRLGAHPLRTV